MVSLKDIGSDLEKNFKKPIKHLRVNSYTLTATSSKQYPARKWLVQLTTQTAVHIAPAVGPTQYAALVLYVYILFCHVEYYKSVVRSQDLIISIILPAPSRAGILVCLSAVCGEEHNDQHGLVAPCGLKLGAQQCHPCCFCTITTKDNTVERQKHPGIFVKSTDFVNP